MRFDHTGTGAKFMVRPKRRCVFFGGGWDFLGFLVCGFFLSHPSNPTPFVQHFLSLGSIWGENCSPRSLPIGLLTTFGFLSVSTFLPLCRCFLVVPRSNQVGFFRDTEYLKSIVQTICASCGEKNHMSGTGRVSSQKKPNLI